MALYWPNKKVALEITDDPNRNPFEGDDSYTVIKVNLDDLSDCESCERIERKLLDALGTCYIADPVYALPGDATASGAVAASEADELMAYMLTLKRYDVVEPSYVPDDLESIEIVAKSELEGSCMAKSAEMSGRKVRGVTVWDGPVPEGSFAFISPTMRMSTPEYYFLRKANELPLPEAVGAGLELCGKFRTKLTQYDLVDNYDYVRIPRTTKAKLSKYLRGCADTKEGRRAKRVLRLVGEECPSPACAWFFVMLSFPASHGGYGLPMPEMTKALSTKQGYLPPAASPYVAYDLAWRDQWVALQYAGATEEGTEGITEAQQGDMHVVFVTDACMTDHDLLDDVAHRLATRLERELPKRDDRWLELNSQLREHVRVPTFDHMRLIMDDVRHHMRG